MAAVTAKINLDAIRQNLNYVKALAPEKSVMAVIKANGYGHSLNWCAEALADADCFAVARMNEAECLRGLTDKDIVVLEGFYNEEELALAAALRLDVVVHSPYQKELSDLKEIRVGAWLKVDTGMNRLGLDTEEFQQILADPGHLSVKGIMSHLACADDEDSPMNLRQIARFHELKTDEVVASLANSAGIMAWPGSHFDVLRPGLMLFGINPFSQGSSHADLRPAMELVAPVISVKKVKQGERVGYGGDWECQEDSLIAIVACGYGDGYRREAPDGTPILINGERFPLIGRVSMDMMCVDVTHGPEVKPGDTATLWGAELPVEEVADCIGTIAYTLVTGLTPRVQFERLD